MLRFHDSVENTIDRERNYMARDRQIINFHSRSFFRSKLVGIGVKKLFGSVFCLMSKKKEEKKSLNEEIVCNSFFVFVSSESRE